MTVNVSKPAFNVREKLSELDIPVGTHGSQLMKSADASESFDLVRAGRKNMIINGQCWINQRSGTSSYEIPNATGGSYGGPDRWAVNEATGGTVNVNMDGDPFNHPKTGVAQFEKAMQFACTGSDTSMGSTENLHFFQNIEGYNTVHLGWGTMAAKPVTLSFWVKTNNAGTYSVGLENSAVDRCCIREFYHNGSHTWKKFSLTYPGCPDGTWLKTNGIGIRVRFCLASGTNFDDGVDGKWVNSDELTAGTQTNFMDSTNNRFFITGVQLEEGPVATPFEIRSYGEELALCQRYYEKIKQTAGNTGRGPIFGSFSSTRFFGYLSCAPKRHSNVAVGYGGGLRMETIDLTSSSNVTGLADYGYNEGRGIFLEVNTTSWGSNGNVYNLSFPQNAYLFIDSEL